MIQLRPLGVEGARNGSAGFTLLETLVALAIAALCVVMLSGIVARLTGAGKTIRAHAAILEESGSIMRLMAGLTGSVDMEMQGASGPNLIGVAQELDVLSRGPAALDLPGETVFRLQFHPAVTANGEATGSLSLEWNDEENAKRFKETVAEGIRSFQLAYRAKGAAGGWSNAWSKSVASLALVRATLEISAAGHTEPVVATFAVHTKLPQVCVINPLWTGCPQW